MILADFASTPAGYISGVYVPIIVTAILGYIFGKLRKAGDEKDKLEGRVNKTENAIELLTYIVNELKQKQGKSRWWRQ